MEKYNNKYRIPTNRLKGWDYSSAGLYFITICTQDKQQYFGNITGTNGSVVLQETAIGSIARTYWEEIPKHFPFAELDEFVIMPDHLHGILLIKTVDGHHWEPNRFGPQSKNVPSIIRGYKASVKRFAVLNNIPFAWQSRYYDRIVRNEHELQAVRKYIINNPLNWSLNKRDPYNTWNSGD